MTVVRRFLERSDFGSAAKYSLLPFRFHALSNNEELLSTDWGEWIVVPRGTAKGIVERTLETESALFQSLKARHIVSDESSSRLLDVAAAKLRTKKLPLSRFTNLHLFVVTLRCEHSCPYCQVSRQTTDRTRFDMSRETADRSIDLALRAPTTEPKIEFQGGEPFLNFELVAYIVEQVEKKGARLGKKPQFVVATNLAIVTEDMLAYCRDHNIHLSTSLDGPEWLHNENRPRPGRDSYARAIAGIELARKVVGQERVAALMTTTRASLDHPRQIVDEYVHREFGTIFLRPISPFGFAVRSRERIGYDTERFIDFYKHGLAYILDLNRKGVRLVENYARLIWTKLLTPLPTWYVDLDSPAGLGIGACVYNYDGDVYASDESRMLAEMGDKQFKLGNVHADSYEAIFGGDTILSAVEDSIAEGLPGCSDCGLQPFCGGDPVYHVATQSDRIGRRTASGFCRRNMAIIEHLLGIYRSGDRQTQKIIWSWITDSPLPGSSREAARASH